MTFLINALAWIAGGLSWFFKDLVPRFAKRLGLGAITGTIQKGVSVMVIALAVAFFGFVVYFIGQIYSAFRNFLNYVENLSGGGEWGSCFLNLLHASGIAQGVSMAAPFVISILVFYFAYATYRFSIMVLKIVSDETFKTGESFK